MPNRARFNLAGIPQHLVQRGNNRQCCFREEDDFRDYLRRLEVCSRRHAVDVHAYVLMSNHVHLLATPAKPQGVSRMMQAVGATYVRAFNAKYGRTGTLWEARFHSCLVDSDAYLWKCYRYVELNPVRAGLAASPTDYPWSSHRANAEGRLDSLVTPHPNYLALGEGEAERAGNYRQLFRGQLEQMELESIRSTLRTQLALGSEAFQAGVEAATGRIAHPRPRGRPKKVRMPKCAV